MIQDAKVVWELSFVSIILLVLTFFVNFIINFAFWFIVTQIYWFFVPCPISGMEEMLTFLIELTCLSVLVPACLTSIYPMQRFFVWTAGGHKAKGADYDRLYSLIEEICKRGNLDPSEYRLYVSKDTSINAFALGNKHIIVNQGSLNAFTDEELIGVLAHEMGHLHLGHTVSCLLCLGMEFFGHIICFAYKVMNFLCKLVYWIPVLGWIVAIFMFLINLQYSLCMILIDTPIYFINMFGIRKSEYQADAYACKIGLGRNLLMGFNHMVQVYGDDKPGFFESLKADHPYSGKRIKRVEKYLEKEQKELQA